MKSPDIELEAIATAERELQPFDGATFWKTFERKSATVNGIRLHYVIGGTGDPVFLLHGWPTSWYEWWRVMPLLADHYTVIAPDLRGLGDSDKPSAGYDKLTLARDVQELGRQLGHSSILVVGHDWGTSVAFALCHEYPQFVRRAVFTDNVIPGLPACDQTWDDLNNHFWHHHFNAEADLPEALVAGRERSFLTWFYRKLTANLAAFTPDYYDEFTRVYSSLGALRAGFGYYRALAEDARQNRLYAGTKLPMPILGVTADRTVGTMLHHQLTPLVSHFRGIVLKDCGHFIPVERPGKLAELIKNFFADSL